MAVQKNVDEKAESMFCYLAFQTANRERSSQLKGLVDRIKKRKRSVLVLCIVVFAHVLLINNKTYSLSYYTYDGNKVYMEGVDKEKYESIIKAVYEEQRPEVISGSKASYFSSLPLNVIWIVYISYIVLIARFVMSMEAVHDYKEKIPPLKQVFEEPLTERQIES